MYLSKCGVCVRIICVHVTADAYGAAAAAVAAEMVIMEVVDVASSLSVHKIRWNSYISVVNDAVLELLYNNTREECHVK